MMKPRLSGNPLIARLGKARRLLLAGAGGGCDIYCALPIYLALANSECEIHLANLTFSNLYGVSGESPVPALTTINADSKGPQSYFPERTLCEWLTTKGYSPSLHCLHRVGAKPIAEAYDYLQQQYAFDAVVLVDGGTDSLMRGDEAGLGTPQEDMASLAAVHGLDAELKLLMCIGFGVDTFHGVCHAHFLEAVAEFTRQDAFGGAFSLTRDMPEAQQYIEAVVHLSQKQQGRESIVNTSIAAAVAGEFGNVHSCERTKGSELWINPLMSMYWAFDLDAVAQRSLYLDAIRDTESYTDLTKAIDQFRHGTTVKPWQEMPV